MATRLIIISLDWVGMATGGFRMGHPHPNLTLLIQNNFYPRSIKKNNDIKLNISYKLLYYYIFYKVFYYFHYYTYIKNKKIKNKLN